MILRILLRYTYMCSQLNNNNNVLSLHRRHSEGNIVEPPRATTSRKRPPIQNTKSFSVKALQLEPLVIDHLL